MAVLEEIVSRTSGLPYREYIRKRVLFPLSSDAEFDVQEVDPGLLATGYVHRWDPMRLALRVLLPRAARRLYRERVDRTIAR